MTEMLGNIFGYYDEPGQIDPEFDPGLPAPCPFCGDPVEPETPLKTISLMMIEGPSNGWRSYFYRTHKFCYEDASNLEIQRIESIIDKPCTIN